MVVGSAVLEAAHRFEYDYDAHFIAKLAHVTATFDIHNVALEIKMTDLFTSLSQQPPPPSNPAAQSPAAAASPASPAQEAQGGDHTTSPPAASELANRTFSENLPPHRSPSPLTSSPPFASASAPSLLSLSGPRKGSAASGIPLTALTPSVLERGTPLAPLSGKNSASTTSLAGTPNATRSQLSLETPPSGEPQKEVTQSIFGGIKRIWVDLRGRNMDPDGNPLNQVSLIYVDVGLISVLESLERRKNLAAGFSSPVPGPPSFEPIIRVTSTCEAIAVGFNSPLLKLYEHLRLLQENPSLKKQLRNIAAELELMKNFTETPRNRLSASQIAKTHHQPPLPGQPAPVKLPRRVTFQTYLRELTAEVYVLPTLKVCLSLSKPNIEVTRHRITVPSSLPQDLSAPEVFETDYSLSLERQSVSFVLVRKPGPVDTFRGDETRLFKFNIPMVHVLGSLRPVPDLKLVTLVTLNATVDKFDVNLKDQILDLLLSAQVSLGSDIAEVTQVLKTVGGDASKDKSPAPPPAAPSTGQTGPASASASSSSTILQPLGGAPPAAASGPPQPTLHFKVDFLFKGIKLELQAPVAVVSLESGVVKAQVRSQRKSPQQLSPTLSWNCVLTGLSLALEERSLSVPSALSKAPAPRLEGVAALGSATSSASSPARLASIVIDLALQNYAPKSEKFTTFASRLGITNETFAGLKESFFVTVPRTHGILQSVAFDLIADVLLFHQKKVREFQRKQKELVHDSAVRARTKTLIKSVNQNLKKINDADSKVNFLEHRLVFFHFSHLGAAIPMVERRVRDAAATSASPAFLVSASDIIFSSRKGEASAVEVVALSLKFVDDFDPHNSKHFRGDHHPTMNCAVLPSIFCQVLVQAKAKPANLLATPPSKAVDQTRVSVEGRVSGIEVDTDTRVASHITDLTEIVLMNQARMVKLLNEARNLQRETENGPDDRARSESGNSSNSSFASPSRDSPLPTTEGDGDGDGDFDGNGSSSSEGDDETGPGEATPGADKSPADSPPLIEQPTLSLQDSELELFAQLDVKPGRLNFFSEISPKRSGPGPQQQQSAYEQLVIPSVTTKARHLSSIGFAAGDKKTHIEIILHPSSTSLFPPMTKYIESMVNHLGKRTSLIPPSFFDDKADQSHPASHSAGVTKKNSSSTGGHPGSASGAAPLAAPAEPFPFLRDASKNMREVSLLVSVSQTMLQLNCSPITKVVASLDISRADLLVTFKSPLPKDPAKELVGPLQSFSALTLSLPLTRVRINHAFSIGEQGDCLHAELRGLSLTASLMDAPGAKGARRANLHRSRKAAHPRAPTSLISGVLNIRKAIFNFNMRQYQDYVAFKKIWLNFPEIRPSAPAPREPGPGPEPHARDASAPAPAPLVEPFLTRRDVALRLVVQINDISLLADLGQSIGKASVVFKALNVVLAKGGQPCFVLPPPTSSLVKEQLLNATVALETLTVNLEGRFEGQMLFECVQIEAIAKDSLLLRVSEGVGGMFSMNEGSFYLKRARLDMKHNLQKVLKLDIDSILLVIKDVWTVPSELFSKKSASHSELPAWEVNLELIFKGIDAKISKETVPALMRMQERLVGLLSSKPQHINALEVGPARTSTLDKQRPKDQREVDPFGPGALAYHATSILGFDIFPSAKLDVRGVNVALTFFKYNLQDLDAAVVTMESFLLELSTQHVPSRMLPKSKATAAARAREDTMAAHQELTINIGETKVQKATFSKTMKKDEIVSEVQSTRDIFVLPSSIMVLETWQVHRESLVFYKFMSDFDGTVDITLNVGLYQYLRELGVLYTRAMAPPGTQLQPPTTPIGADKADLSRAAQSPPPPQSTDTEVQTSPSASLPKEGEDVEGRHAAGAFEFQALVPMQLEPQLKALGEATPPLEKVLGWMGVDKKMIPSWTHAYLSANVEEGLILLQEKLTELGSKPESH